MTAAAVREVGAPEAVGLARAGYRVVDVRDLHEWEQGHVAGAVLLPLADVPERIAEVAPDRSTPLLLYCAVGARSLHAAGWLAQLGYADVASMRATPDEWRAAGGPWEEAATTLGEDERRRYARQLRIPEIGVAGQRRLDTARVLIVGAGGLGSPVALYLAAAGVGTLGIVDDDVVDVSNLQRQVLHATGRIGMSKVESAERALRDLNPDVRVVGHRERLDSATVDRLLVGYEVVVDASDNFDTRYALNDAAVRAGTPVVHGSVYRWDGQVTTFMPFRGPCYRCMYPEPPPEAIAPACDVAGVVGVLPGLVGMLQAAETLKLLLGIGEPLVGRLLMVDALGTTFDEVRVPRDPGCPACGSAASSTATAGE
jgi:molybdopterin/thiamine biosynthesis adenylyltransferase/rhodanese-related sulfurtransferase